MRYLPTKLLKATFMCVESHNSYMAVAALHCTAVYELLQLLQT